MEPAEARLQHPSYPTRVLATPVPTGDVVPTAGSRDTSEALALGERVRSIYVENKLFADLGPFTQFRGLNERTVRIVIPDRVRIVRGRHEVSEMEVWSAVHGTMPKELDPATAHLVDVRGAADEWTIRCFWLNAEDPEGILGTGTAQRPCAVVTPCERCAAGLDTLPAEGREYIAHDQRHAVAGDPAVGYRLLPDLCGMSLVFAEDGLGSSWLADLQETYGPGMYLVHPAATADGSLIGTNPIRVVD